MSDPEAYPRLRVTMFDEQYPPLQSIGSRAWGLSQLFVVDHLLGDIDNLLTDQFTARHWRGKGTDPQLEFIGHSINEGMQAADAVRVESMRMESPWQLILIVLGGATSYAARTADRFLSVWDHLQESRVNKARADFQVAAYKSLTSMVNERGIDFELMNRAGLDQQLQAVSQAVAQVESIELLPSEVPGSN